MYFKELKARLNKVSPVLNKDKNLFLTLLPFL